RHRRDRQRVRRFAPGRARGGLHRSPVEADPRRGAVRVAAGASRREIREQPAVAGRRARAGSGSARREGRAIAARLADALALGDVTDLERFAGELETGPAGEAAIAERIRRLAAGFDFDGLRGLSERLAARGERTDA